MMEVMNMNNTIDHPAKNNLVMFPASNRFNANLPVENKQEESANQNISTSIELKESPRKKGDELREQWERLKNFSPKNKQEKLMVLDLKMELLKKIQAKTRFFLDDLESLHSLEN